MIENYTYNGDAGFLAVESRTHSLAGSIEMAQQPEFRRTARRQKYGFDQFWVS